MTVAFAAGGRPPFGTGASDAIMYRIVHAAPDISAVPPDLHPLVEAALAKDPQARPGAAQLLGQLTSTQPTGAGARYENPTQTVLAQAWHPASPMPVAPPVTSPSRRRAAVLPIVLTLAFLLAAGGTALGLFLASKPASPAASGSTTTASSPGQPQKASTGSAATTPTSPTNTTTTTAPASTPVSTPVSTPASTVPAQLPVLSVGSYTGMKPTEIAFSGDSGNVVTKITWSSWTATQATGQGTSDIDSCVPSCAQAPPSIVPATIILSAPVNGRFTKMTEIRNGSTSYWTYPGTWPGSAS